MEKAESVAYQQKIEEYLENNKLGDYFAQLTKQLILNQPEDPIKWLIEFLGNQRKIQKVIFFSGVLKDEREQIVESCSTYLNYKKISVNDIFKNVKDIATIDNDTINKEVLKSIKQAEEHYRGYIVSGYPNNYNQGIFIQQSGIIPERMYIIKNKEIDSRFYYEKLYGQNSQQIGSLLARDQLNENELKQVFGGYCDIFDLGATTKAEIIENIKSMLKLKDQRTYPLRGPRIVIVRPPHLKKRGNEIYNILAQKYGFHKISSSDLIQQHINKQKELGKYLNQCLEDKKEIPQDIMAAIIRTEIMKPLAKHKGWILEGYPKDQQQLSVFTEFKINPHLVIILDDDEDTIKEQYQQIIQEDLESSQINKKKSTLTLTNENLQETVTNYKEFIKQCESVFGNHTQRFKMKKETTEKIIKQIDVFVNNPKIYS